MPAKRKGDRAKLVPLILDRIANGETLVSICRDFGIGRQTGYDWLAGEGVRLAHAREAGADTLATQALAIADCTDGDTIQTDSGEVCNREWIARSKLRVETRLRLAAVFCPSKYGHKAQLEHSGPKGGPIENVTRVVLCDLVAEGEAG